jgi:cystathionine beta-lyase/cystathionine gamma-synthase
MGVEVTMADLRDPSSYEEAIQDNTKVLYVETMTNPVLKVCDLEAMSEIAERNGIISIVDNTFASPWGCNPVSMGFDIVLHSGTKYLGGHADLIAGLVAGKKELIADIFFNKIHFGGAADPHMCYLLERGMRTLHARMPIHAANSAELAKRLDNHDMVESVRHTSLASHPDYEVAKRIMPKGSGMLAFVVKGGDEAALKFMRSLDMVFEATSLGGVESLVECPFNSSHMFVPEDVRNEAGVVSGFVRMSVGIEDVEDLWKDIDSALKAANEFLETRA